MKYYGHGPHLCEELREVPWFVVESEDRRTVTADTPVETDQSNNEGAKPDQSNDEEVQNRLEALGYI
jgi:hypothetical protein